MELVKLLLYNQNIRAYQELLKVKGMARDFTILI